LLFGPGVDLACHFWYNLDGLPALQSEHLEEGLLVRNDLGLGFNLYGPICSSIYFQCNACCFTSQWWMTWLIIQWLIFRP
jgi:hypothetical protein